MRFCRNTLSFALAAWLSALCAPASAQVTPGQWVGDLYMTDFNSETDSFVQLFVDGEDSVRGAIPNVISAGDAPWLCRDCGGSLWSRWHGGALYAVADGGPEAGGDGRAYRRHAFAKWEGGAWGLVGTYRTGRGDSLNSVPCDGGRFIVVSSRTDLYDGGRRDRSPFCLMSAPEGGGEMRLDAPIDHGQEGLRKHMAEPGCFWLAVDSDIAITDGRATLVNRRTGLYWVFSTETARLVKAGSIFGNMPPERMAAGGIDRAVLCVNPEKSGTVLLSAQDEGPLLAEREDAQKESMALYERLPDGQCDDEINELRIRRMEEIRARSPLMVWYRIHPEDGRLERLPAPPEGGASLRDAWGNEYWRPMPDGSVRMGWDPHLLDKIKAQASASLRAGGKRGEGGAKEVGGAGPGQEGGAPPEGGGTARTGGDGAAGGGGAPEPEKSGRSH